jgi:hypothetical protein
MPKAQPSGAASLVLAAALVPPTALLGIAGGPVARVGIAVALVGEVVAFIGSPLPLIEVVPGPVQGGDPLALSRLDDRRILSRG